MTLIIKKVGLRDFLSHSRTDLDLGRGVTVLVGENGAGKSSVVDAIYLALTGDYDLRGAGKESLIRRGAGSASVTVELEDTENRDTLTVEVELHADKPTTMTLKVNGRVEARGVREVPRAVAQRLGIPASELREARGLVGYALILRQGYLREIIEYLTGPPEERGRFFEDVLGATAYRRAGEALRDLEVEVEGFKVTASQSSLRALSDQKSRLRVEEGKLRGERAALEGVVAEAERRLEAAYARLREAEAAEAEYVKLAGALGEVEKRLAAVESELARLEAEAAKLREAAGRVEEARVEYERLRRLAGLAGLVAELERARRLRAEASEAALRASKLRRALEEYQANAWAEGRLKELQASEEEGRRLLAEARARVARLEERLRAARQALERAEARARELAGLAGIPRGEPGAVLEGALGVAAGLRVEAEELRRRAVEARARAAKARGQAERLSLYAATLRGEGSDRCPLCGQPLPPGGAAALAGRLEASARELLGEAGAAEAEAGRLEAEAAAREARARSIEDAAIKLKAELEALKGLDVGRLESEQAEALKALGSVEEALRRIQGEKPKVEVAARRALEARATALQLAESLGLNGLPTLEEAGRLERDYKARALEAEGRVREIEGRLLAETGAGSVEEAVRAVTGAVGRLSRVEEEYRRALEAEAALAKVEGRLGELRGEAEALRRERERITSRMRELEPLAREAGRLRGEVEELRGKLGEARGRLAWVERRLAEVKAEAEKLEAATWQLSKLLMLREILEKTLPRRVLQSKLAALERVMSDVLASFNLDYKAVVISTGSDGREGRPLIDIRAVSSTGGDATLASLSGGERTAVALAFVLALGKISSVKAGFLVLDEPTSELDEERREKLVEVLRSMGGGEAGIPQLIVVTHDEDVKEAADTICRVTKSLGRSEVRCEGGGEA